MQYKRPCQFHICFQSFFKSIKTLPICFNETTLRCFFSSSCFLTSWFLDPIRGHLAAARRVLVPSDCDLTRPEKHAAARRSIQLATTHNGYALAHTQTCPTVDVGGRDRRPFVWKKRRKKEKGKRPRRKRDRSGAGKIKRRNGGEERPSSSFHILFPPPFAVSARLASFRPSHASRVSPGCGRQCIAERARRRGQGSGGQKRKSFVAFLRRRWNCVAVKVAGNQKRITFSAPTK